MKSELTVQELLRWRLKRAEDDAPAPPRAAELIALARPWWESCPEVFTRLSEHMLRIPENCFALAMAEPRRPQGGYLVPTLVATHVGEFEAYARVLYFEVRDGRLRLRFHLEGPADLWRDYFEATFVAESGEPPLFLARAQRSVPGEYHLEADLPGDVGDAWRQLKATDRMPFRLILRPASADE